MAGHRRLGADAPTKLTPVQVTTILQIVDSGRDSNDLRLALSIPLGPFNRALRDLGRPPLHFGGQHEAVFAHFLNEHRESLSARLRRHFMVSFQSVEDLTIYSQLRHLPH